MRLELTILAALAPQASVYTIPPSGQRLVRVERLELSIPKAGDFKSPVYTIPPHSRYWSARMDSNHQQYHTKSLADFQGIRTLCPNRRRAVYRFSTHRLRGTPTQIRTERTTPFERVDFTNLSIGACKLDPQQFYTLCHFVAYGS